MTDFPVETGIRLSSDIVPIFLCEEREGLSPITLEQTGTAFRLTDDLIVTCWHCVPDDQSAYAVAFEAGDGQYRMHPLLDLSRDAGGADLATARLHEPERAPPRVGLQLAAVALATGSDVSTWGYPLTTKDPEQGGPRFTLNARYLEGYVTRSFWYIHPVDGRVATYEVDMPAPAGLSGAPLLRRGSKDVVGVIYGRTESIEIDAFASVDPDTGERNPEVQRVVSFAAAHYTEQLHLLSGTATEGLPLSAYLSKDAPLDDE